MIFLFTINLAISSSGVSGAAETTFTVMNSPGQGEKGDENRNVNEIHDVKNVIGIEIGNDELPPFLLLF